MAEKFWEIAFKLLCFHTRLSSLENHIHKGGLKERLETAILASVAYHLDKDLALKLEKHFNLPFPGDWQHLVMPFTHRAETVLGSAAPFFTTSAQRWLSIFLSQ